MCNVLVAFGPRATLWTSLLYCERYDALFPLTILSDHG